MNEIQDKCPSPETVRPSITLIGFINPLTTLSTAIRDSCITMKLFRALQRAHNRRNGKGKGKEPELPNVPSQSHAEELSASQDQLMKEFYTKRVYCSVCEDLLDTP